MKEISFTQHNYRLSNTCRHAHTGPEYPGVLSDHKDKKITKPRYITAVTSSPLLFPIFLSSAVTTASSHGFISFGTTILE